MSAPLILSKVEPEYTEEARKVGFQGTVLLNLVVGTDGRAQDVKAVRKIGLGLDEKAVEAVSTWRFRPGEKDGEPVPVFATVEVSFHLLNVSHAWEIRSLVFNPSRGSRPQLLKMTLPQKHPSPGRAVPVTIRLTLDESGSVADATATPGPDPEIAEPLVTAVRKWKFEPSTKNGQPVAADGILQLVPGIPRP